MKDAEFEFRIFSYQRNKFHDFNDYMTNLELLRNDNWNDNFEIELWSGFYDKNGKKVYDGDLFSWNGELATIVYDKGWFKARHKKFADTSLYSFENKKKENFLTIKVLGNIHENPELLKPKEVSNQDTYDYNDIHADMYEALNIP